jgi:hypothetical protein
MKGCLKCKIMFCCWCKNEFKKEGCGCRCKQCCALLETSEIENGAGLCSRCFGRCRVCGVYQKTLEKKGDGGQHQVCLFCKDWEKDKIKAKIEVNKK